MKGSKEQNVVTVTWLETLGWFPNLMHCVMSSEISFENSSELSNLISNLFRGGKWLVVPAVLFLVRVHLSSLLMPFLGSILISN